MESRRMSEKELRKLIYSERRKLRADIAGVRALAKTSASVPLDAVIKSRDLERRFIEKSVKRMDKGELQSVYRDIKYIQGLKTSTVEGAERAAETWTPIKEYLETLSPDTRDKFWKAYGKAVGNQGLLYSFKYEIFSALTDEGVLGQDTSELSGKIREIYGELYEKYGGDTENEPFKASFSRELHKRL